MNHHRMLCMHRVDCFIFLYNVRGLRLQVQTDHETSFSVFPLLSIRLNTHCSTFENRNKQLVSNYQRHPSRYCAIDNHNSYHHAPSIHYRTCTVCTCISSTPRSTVSVIMSALGHAYRVRKRSPFRSKDKLENDVTFPTESEQRSAVLYISHAKPVVTGSSHNRVILEVDLSATYNSLEVQTACIVSGAML
jgi:hypothetical protein